MSQFLRKALHFRTSSLVCLQNPRFRWFSVSSVDDKKQSFTVSYLMNSVGFSPKMALTASKYVSFDSNEKPDKAIEFFTNYGFTETQISTLVRTFPRVLLSDTEKRILPKLEFLKSKGMKVPEMAKMLSSFPHILKASLRNRIIPSYDYIVNFLKSDEKTISCVKRYPDILGCKLENVVSNTDILRGREVPESTIAYLIQFYPRCIGVTTDRFQKAVGEIMEMGFDVSTTKFAVAICVSLGISRENWQSKVETYMNCGFSEEEVSKAFRRNPRFMSHSQGKILEVMDFFVNEMSWSPQQVTVQPVVIGLSLKKRIIPRCSVFKFLCSEGLVKKKVSLYVLLASSDEKFLKKYVECYEKEAPKLLKLYHEKLGF